MSFEHNPQDELPKGDAPLPNSAVDEFFVKMNREVRRPKPSDEAVAAALQAIQKLAGEFAEHEAAAAASSSPGQEMLPGRGEACSKCGGVNPDGNRFCGFCGAVINQEDSSRPSPPLKTAAPVQHLYHHHHHYHHYASGAANLRPPEGGETVGGRTAETDASSPSVEASGREPALRQLVEDWAANSNAKLSEQVTALYSFEGLVLRPDTPSVRGHAAIERHLKSAFESGFGEVQLEITDLRVLGTIAWITGISLLTAAPPNRQERTGKFLLLARYESEGWKILADVWCLNREPAATVTDSAPAAKEAVPATESSQHARYRYTW